VNPRAGLYDVEKRKFLTLLGLELRPLGRPARSQSLYQLPYYYYFFIIIWFVRLLALRHSWPIVPASGDNEDDCGEADGM
jgi:hypothetical protein